MIFSLTQREKIAVAIVAGLLALGVLGLAFL